MRESILRLSEGNAAQVEQSILAATHSGLLESAFPGWNKQIGCMHDPRSHLEGGGDLIVHVAKVTANAAQYREVLNTQDYSNLFAAALLHDICKPETRTIIDGKVSLPEHDNLGARRAFRDARAISMSAEDASLVSWLVAEHMNVHKLPERKESVRLSYYRHPNFKLLSFLQAADARAVWLTPDGEQYATVHVNFFADDKTNLEAAADLAARQTEFLKRVNSVLKELKIEPGPIYSELGRDAYAAHQERPFSADEDIREWVVEQIHKTE